VAAPPPVAPTQAPPRSRHPRKRQPRPGRRRTESPRRPQWRRLHQPRPRRPRRVAAAPVRDAATRRRPPARQRAPGVADSDRSQSQDGPLASGPKVLGSSVCEGLLGRARRRTESLVETCGEGGISALVGPTLSRVPNGNGPVRGQLSAWVGTALSRFPSGNGPARGQPAAWVGPTLSRIPRGNRPARGQPAACGLLGRSDAVSGPLWTRASEGTAAGTSLASSGVSYRRRRCELSAPRTSFWSPFARFSHDSVRKAPPRRGDCGRRP
jgi:hypothetical protein